MTYVTSRGSVFRARASWASDPSSRSGASASRWTPSAVLRRSPARALRSIVGHMGSRTIHRRAPARRTADGWRRPVARSVGSRTGTRTPRLREPGGRGDGANAGLPLLLPPGERDELAAVLGESNRDRLAAEEDGGAAVHLYGRLAADDQAAENP